LFFKRYIWFSALKKDKSTCHVIGFFKYFFNNHLEINLTIWSCLRDITYLAKHAQLEIHLSMTFCINFHSKKILECYINIIWIKILKFNVNLRSLKSIIMSDKYMFKLWDFFKVLIQLRAKSKIDYLFIWRINTTWF
jgi:hypothetical protein